MIFQTLKYLACGERIMKPAIDEAGDIAPFSVTSMPISSGRTRPARVCIRLWSGSDGYPTAGRIPWYLPRFMASRSSGSSGA